MSAGQTVGHPQGAKPVFTPMRVHRVTLHLVKPPSCSKVSGGHPSPIPLPPKESVGWQGRSFVHLAGPLFRERRFLPDTSPIPKHTYGVNIGLGARSMQVLDWKLIFGQALTACRNNWMKTTRISKKRGKNKGKMEMIDKENAPETRIWCIWVAKKLSWGLIVLFHNGLRGGSKPRKIPI